MIIGWWWGYRLGRKENKKKKKKKKKIKTKQNETQNKTKTKTQQKTKTQLGSWLYNTRSPCPSKRAENEHYSMF